MTFEEFSEALKEEVQNIVKENCHVEIHEIQKNNVGRMPALNIMETGVAISPNFYLKSLYEKFQEHEVSVTELAKKLVELHYESVHSPELEISLPFQNPEELRRRLFFRLVHYEKNRELLEKTAHIKFLDMALVYYVFVYHDDKTVGSMRVNASLFHHFGWNEEEMYQEVLANTRRLFPEKITSISQFLEELSEADLLDEEFSLMDQESLFRQEGVSILITNTAGVNGAAVIVYPDLLQKLAGEIGYNLFLLPSSVHEILVLPDNGKLPVGQLEEMVAAVNRECVSPEEVLSDHVYYYNADSDRLMIADADTPVEEEK